VGDHERHFMDGDGCVLSLSFPGGGAMPRFANKYVRTKGFVEEQASASDSPSCVYVWRSVDLFLCRKRPPDTCAIKHEILHITSGRSCPHPAQAAGKPIHRNAFTRGAADGSPLFNPLDFEFKNVANTGVLHWNDRLWALWEVSSALMVFGSLLVGYCPS
jgi:carotenoid cleavage dioxygenase-like enzyme